MEKAEARLEENWDRSVKKGVTIYLANLPERPRRLVVPAILWKLQILSILLPAFLLLSHFPLKGHSERVNGCYHLRKDM